ncbi:MAG: hypothetical protein JMN27_07980 [gamma proteobacterium endosymbiont of Lamellibrachia anaximandri]|nr:hypothetical protein [gamma proteobacterium endosymbiont of Lamellibrachia anaximandri]MBL3533754.1 hypothetical protein [gamma proteobacterium endosymbiont of Lamellibrachia anaximandri]
MSHLSEQTQETHSNRSTQQSVRRTSALLERLRKTPWFQQLIPAEAGIGWPIPLRRNGKVYMRIPFFGFSPTSEKGKTALFPPFALVTLDWASLVPAEYVNLQFRNPWPDVEWGKPVGHFPHESVASLAVGEYKEKRKELLELYNELFDKLSQGSDFSEEWNHRFSTTLNILMEPSLEPYYRTLGKNFFNHYLPSKTR